MKKTKLKIIAAEPISDGSEASYLFLENKIIYRKYLDKFPKVRKIIIDHELRHSEKPFNQLHHLKIDIIDELKILFNRDYFNYREHCFKKFKTQLSGYEGNKLFLFMGSIIRYFIMKIYLILLEIIKIPIKIYFKRIK